MTERMDRRPRSRVLEVEKRPFIAAADTVRAVLWNGERFLLLQKAKDSKNPFKWELPGGNIDGVIFGQSTLSQQQATLITEVNQETGIAIDDRELGTPASYSYTFTIANIHHDRTVHTFAVVLPTREYQVVINKTRRDDGGAEDNHMAYRWVTKEEYDRMRRDGDISSNSMML